MRFFIKSVTGKQGFKSFKTLNEYVEFITKKGHLIKELKEADLPYTDKPVKLPKVSKSNGWSEVSDFGEVGEEAEKGESLIASTSKSVMKDEANFEMSKSSGKADKQEMGLGAEKGDIDMSDFKSFEYEEPKIKSSETKTEKSSSNETKDESKKETKSSETKEMKKDETKKEKKEDKMNNHDKEIEECLRAAGVQLNEFFKFDSDNSKEDDSDEYKTYKKYMNKEISDDEARSELKKQGYKGKTAKNLVKNAKTKRDTKLKEGIKDYLPRAGFIRDDDEDKSSRKMGVWGGQGTDDQLRKAKIIAKVKFANGDRMGRVTKEDLDNFDEYKAQYDEIYGSEELDEGWKDKFKKGAATLGVAASLAGNAMAHNSMYDGARSPDTLDHTQEYSQEYEKPQISRIKGNMVIDQYGNEWTREEFDKLSSGESPFNDGARNPNIDEDVDEDVDIEIAECLRIAGC